MKFAGDAMLIVWKVDEKEGDKGHTLDELRAIAAAKAVACATSSIDLLRGEKSGSTSAQRQSMMGGMMRADMSPSPHQRSGSSNIPSPVKLQIHVGVGVGEMAGIHVGGLRQRWEYIVMGECANMMMRAEDIGKVNQVVACPQTKTLLDRNNAFLKLSHFNVAEGENGNQLNQPQSSPFTSYLDHNPLTHKPPHHFLRAVEKGFSLISGFKSDRVYKDMMESVLKTTKLRADTKTVYFRKEKVSVGQVSYLYRTLRSYIPAPIIAKIDEMEDVSNDGVLRELCVLFVKLNNLSGLNIDTTDEVLLTEVSEKIQKTVVTVQEAAYHGRATLRQFIIDDKGAVAIIVVGLPPVTAIKNSSRGLKIALRILENGIPAQIGVTTGICYCGTIGSSTSRGDFAVVGDHINMAARLMGKAPEGKILCDNNTMMAAKNDKSLTFYDKKTLRVKGKSQPIVAYSPARKIQSVLAPVDFLSMQRSPLIGQAEVWKTLQFQHQFRNKSKPQLIQILGPKLSGKTKLINMFSKTQQLERITVVTARADKFECTTSYFVFREILYNIFEHGVNLAR